MGCGKLSKLKPAEEDVPAMIAVFSNELIWKTLGRCLNVSDLKCCRLVNQTFNQMVMDETKLKDRVLLKVKKGKLTPEEFGKTEENWKNMGLSFPMENALNFSNYEWLYPLLTEVEYLSLRLHGIVPTSTKTDFHPLLQRLLASCKKLRSLALEPDFILPLGSCCRISEGMETVENLEQLEILQPDDRTGNHLPQPQGITIPDYFEKLRNVKIFKTYCPQFRMSMLRLPLQLESRRTWMEPVFLYGVCQAIVENNRQHLRSQPFYDINNLAVGEVMPLTFSGFKTPALMAVEADCYTLQLPTGIASFINYLNSRPPLQELDITCHYYDPADSSLLSGLIRAVARHGRSLKKLKLWARLGNLSDWNFLRESSLQELHLQDGRAEVVEENEWIRQVMTNLPKSIKKLYLRGAMLKREQQELRPLTEPLKMEYFARLDPQLMTQLEIFNAGQLVNNEVAEFTCKNLKMLRTLNLSNVQADDQGFQAIAELKGLQSLTLRMCGISDETLKLIRFLELRFLDVADNVQESRRMYWEWATLSGVTDTLNDRTSVLERLPPEAAKDVVVPVVRHIVTTLGISQPASASPFTNEKDIDWNLQVICFGLSLPLTEHEIIKDCVSIYCEWLSCLAPVPKICVPKPLTDRPNFFARKMINHLYHLFSPRKGELQDTINRQAVLCHRVLRTLQNVIKTSNILDAETWECVLLFLISINDALLSPPTIKEDIGDQLCDRVLSVLFEIWLLSCSKAFPSPPLWKTLRDSCRCWRHRSNLFDHWSRINLLLTVRVLHIMYGMDYIKIEDETNFIPKDMSPDCVVQTWFRMLHCVGNPVELTQPTIISQTQNFLQYAIASEAVVDPCQHPCLSVLPSIFLQAMKGIATLVDAFLGLPRTSIFGGVRSKDTSSIPSSTSSSLQSQGSISLQSIMGENGGHLRSLPSPERPRVNSILHLFGPWLFEAALISCNETKMEADARRTSRGSAVPAALPENIDIPQAITIDKYYLGRAEALGTLCRIFCSKKTGEEILPAYLARFYIAVRKGLKDTRTEVLGAIVSNCPNLFRVDLDGVNILMPSIISALETVLPSKDALRNDLRRPAIQLLLSILPLPLHFLNVPIKEIGDKSGGSGNTFFQFKSRLANLLINTLQVETDSVNIQMLLGGLLMFVTDTASFEEMEKGAAAMGTESPTNLLCSENTSMRSLSDYSNSLDDHSALGFYDPSDNSVDSAHALFVRTTYLTCHRLISTWKGDLSVSLAALELLNGLAKTRVHEQDPLECRRAVKWICDFIIHQCSRPPPAHSKDLHSSIVAAFQCVTTWLTGHPFLLEDKESLSTVLEVVEYGISGTKSVGKPGEPVKYKDEKNQNPVSLRVRDAAEALLSVIFEQAENPEPVKGAALVDEFALVSQVCPPGSLTRQEIVNHFRYYVIDHCILIALLEEPILNEPDPQAMVTAILRGPTGRHTWTFQMRHMARNKGTKGGSFGGSNGSNPGRPLPMNDVGVQHDVQQRYFPEGVDRITACRADRAIPPLEVASEDGDSLEQSRLSIILENQIRLEKRVASMIQEESDESYPNMRSECVPPAPCQEFQTARLLLSHLGFISIQVQKDYSFPKLVPIDSKNPDFIQDLDTLDATSHRTCDTVHIFYVRAGQRKAEDILGNVQSRANVSPHFLEFLMSLGWPVSVSRHSGWTGNMKTSWKRVNSIINDDSGVPVSYAQQLEAAQGGAIYNGEQQVLYWSDVISEMAFVVPTVESKRHDDASVWNNSGSNGTEEKKQSEPDKPPRTTITTGKSTAAKFCDTKMFVVWLESFEDSFHFPASQLMDYTMTGMEGANKPTEPHLIIFIQAMRNGLFRIHMEGQPLRMGFATPLIDGMVLSRRVLGNLVRQTALNMGRRKRLESENFQPPHVRRKLRIQEIIQRFAQSKSEPEFFTDFYKSLVQATII